MAKTHEFEDEEEYIEMELISNSPTKNREFEFQIQNSLSSNDERENLFTTFLADELFYKGKLLPLNLLSTTTTAGAAATFDFTKTPFRDHHNYYPLPLTAPCTNTSNTPHDSSPSESCRASCELNPDDYFFEWSTELSSFINNHPSKKSKKLKLFKKLKASRAYLKSLFTKSSCADNPTATRTNPKDLNVEMSNKYFTFSKKKQLAHLERASYPTIASIIKNIDKETIFNEDNKQGNVQRRSFSSAIKRHSPTKCLSSSSSGSSSFSVNSNGVHEMQLSRRSISRATEIEGSIEAAIAHCKRSNQQIFCSFSADEEKQKQSKSL